MTVLAELVADSGQERRRAGYRVDAVTTALGVWFAVGLFLDAWAHNNVPELESFFTPWHAVFYSGFTATAAWTLWTVWRNVRDGRRGAAAVPVGYGLAVVALPVFAAAGVGDYLWHTAFGIEQSLNILFSPTHLVLVTAMVLILTSPLRSAWLDPDLPVEPSLLRVLPAVVVTAFTGTLALLFVQYGNAMVWGAGGIVHAFSFARDLPAEDGAQLAAAIALTSVVLLAPLLLLARRFRPPFGTATVVYAAAAGLCGSVTGFRNLSVMLGLLLAGPCADLLGARLRPGPGRRAAFLAYAGLVPLVTWSLYFAVTAADVGRLPSVVEMWTGTPVVTALLGLTLGALMAPPPTP